MSFGENLQFLRKQHDLTQEGLAEQLAVSRQSVSKWESDVAFPEMNTIIQLCDLFSCDMDTLLRGDASRLFVTDSAGYDRFMTRFARSIAGSVAGILAGVGLSFLLNGLATPEAISVSVLLLAVAVSVVVLVASGIQYDDFTKHHPVIADFYTPEQKETFHRKFIWYISGSVGAILAAVALLCLFFGFFPEQEPYESFAGSGLLFILAGAVFFLIYGGIMEDKYNIEKYNKEQNPTPEEKRRSQRIGALWGCGMVAATAIYVGLGLAWELWGQAWVVYPVVALICVAVTIFLSRDSED